MDTTSAREQINEWRTVASERTVIGAQDVQDRLLDLYGTVKGAPAARHVERYLSLTSERSLFERDEIEQLLDEIEANLPQLARS